MDRAYAQFEIKSIDAEQRVITGIASTPESDRGGDRMVSKGARFTLPMPFRFRHSTDIGEVFAADVAKSGITIKARVIKVDEPGQLKDEIEYAWQSIRYGLAKGLSIGWKPIEATPNKNGGLDVSEWDWLETSAVPIPMNASSTITSIKSFDAPFLAASGEGQGTVTHKSAAGVALVSTAARKGAHPMKTLTEQISAFEAKRTANEARRMEIQQKASDEGRTKEEAEKTEFDTLGEEVKRIDAELVDLRDMEASQKAAAVPARGETQRQATESRGGNVITIKQNLPPGIEFARYAICVMLAKGNLWQAQEIAKARYPDQPRILNVIHKAVAAGTTSDAGWAGALVDYQNLTSEFIEFLRPSTIIGKFGTGNIPSLTNVPFNVRIIGQTSGGDGYWVGEGKPKPLTKFDFAPSTLTWAKVAAISVLAEELVRFSSPSAEMLVRNALRDALVARLDTDFVDPDKVAVANVSPASITHGLAPISSAGSSAANVSTDIQALMTPFIGANLSPAGGVFIMSQTRALALSLMKNALGQPEYPGITMLGGTFLGFPVITSQYVAAGSPTNDLVIFVNAPDIYLSDDGQVVIDASREASLEMSATPTQNGAAGTGASLVSLWQNNLLGLRAERFINWAKRRPEAVAYLDSVTWGS